MARGIALIAAAVLLGVVLLNATDSSEPFASVETEDDGRDDETPPADDEVDDEGDDTSTTEPAEEAHNPAEVTVLVANGAGIDGLASRISDTLRAANFVTTDPTNTKETADVSAVYYTPGYEADAAAIAELLNVNPAPTVAAMPDPAPVDDLKSAQVLVVAAADLAQATS